ncbi:MAG TPA: hypothetical protein VEQ63_13790, partial [Bryobacteraceae bacterium]|nr:hypothetical protein [Bryobacteraceae bacterium]
LTPDVDWSSAYSVNDARQVAGTYMSSGSFRAFVWEGTTGMRNIGPSAVQNSYAMDINNDGYVTGTAVGLDGVQRGYLYSAGSGSLLFDGLGSGRSFGYGLNSRNDVVGNYYDHIGDSRAFVWIRGTMLDLTSLVEDANWVLESAYDINDAGQIVGRGRYQGQETAFRLDFANQVVYEETPASGDAAVPEPATGLLAVCGAAVMLFHKKLAKLQ